MRRWLAAGALFSSTALFAGAAGADPVLRLQVDQRGDFLMFGNSSAYDCGGTPVAPTVGTVTCPGTSGQPAQSDSAPDLFWRSDEPADGEATASNAIAPDQARSTAVLALPNGAVITHARLYWAGVKTSAFGADKTVTLDPPGGAASVMVKGDTANTEPASLSNIWYQATADITDVLVQNGQGPYRLSGIESIDFRDVNNNDPVLGWVAVVFYQLDTEPPRNLALFDGLSIVPAGFDAQVSINGFLVPDAGFDAKLGVIAYEGDFTLTGDSLEFNGTALSDAVNPIDNFFNGSRSRFGTPLSNTGDLPQLTGGANSMAGVDFDVVDVTDELTASDTTATVRATSSGDAYLLGAFVTSISTFKPSFATSTKGADDVNGGSTLPGDEIEYTIVAINDGNDASVGTVVVDALPVGVTYVPGSLTLSDGANAGALSDAAGDDLGEYDASSRTVTVRLGTGADASVGGSIVAAEAATVTFRVTVDAGVVGTISNQATITAAGELGATSADYLTDADDSAPEAQTTDIEVAGCATDSDCGDAAPRCDGAASPKVCVGCLADTDCTSDEAPNCLQTQACGCAAGEGKCGTSGEAGAAGSGGEAGEAPTSGSGGTSSGGTSFGGTTSVTPGMTIEGGGCSCRMAGDRGQSLGALLALASGIFTLGRRRWRRVSSRPWQR